MLSFIYDCVYNFSVYCQIVGHSLGGGTAALLTYILREYKEFASSTCFTFAPGKDSAFYCFIIKLVSMCSLMYFPIL